jgi:hypothetical protein
MKEGKGCGCLLMCTAVTALATIAVVGGIYWFVWSTANSLDPEAKPLPVPEMSEDVEKEVEFTERTVKRMVDEGAEGELALTPDLLNAWLRLSSRPSIRFVGEHSWVLLEGSQVVADVALPLSPIGVPDRYFNGRLTLAGGLVDKKVTLVVRSVTPEGAAMSIEWISWLLVGRDLAEPFGFEDLLGSDLMERCTIAARESKLNITCKRSGG